MVGSPGTLMAAAACPSSSSSFAVQTTSRNPYESRGFSHIGGIAATTLQLGFFFSFFRASSAQPMLPLTPSLYPKCVTFCLSAVTMADPLYSRSQMSTVAAAAIAVRGCREGGRGRETIPKGTLVARCPTNLGSARRRRGRGGRGTAHTATRVTTTTTKRRRRRAGELKGPRRSSICEGCNGVLTGLAALRTAHCRKRRGEEKKANLGDIYCRNRGIGRPSIARSLSALPPRVPLSLFQAYSRFQFTFPISPPYCFGRSPRWRC